MHPTLRPSPFGALMDTEFLCRAIRDGAAPTLVDAVAAPADRAHKNHLKDWLARLLHPHRGGQVSA